MNRGRVRAGFLSAKSRSVVAVALASAVLVAAVAATTASAGVTAGNAFPAGSSWKYLTHPVAEPTGWQTPAFDDSTWGQANAPFGDDDGSTCSGILPAPPWNAAVFPAASGGDSKVLLRKSFSLPGNAYGLRLLGTVDNDADVYVNGTIRGSVSSGSCELDAIDLSIANSGLNLGDDNLVAIRAVDHGVISFFDLQATYGVVEFGQQPTETQKGVAIAPAPTVTITDAEGDPVAGATVTVALETIAGTGSLTGDSTTTVATDFAGVATFSNLKVSDVGKYKLVATSDGATTTSSGFLIANEVVPCSGSCDASGSVPKSTAVDASATNAAGALAVSVFAGVTPPTGACAGFVPLGAGSFVNILQTGGALPDFTITWQLDKSLVKKAGSPAASKFNICLGAEDLQHPDGTGATPWKTKSGGNAVPFADPDLGVTLFWGILPDCKGRPAGPCVLHRNKTNAGDVVVTFFKPAPWDGHVFGG